MVGGAGQRDCDGKSQAEMHGGSVERQKPAPDLFLHAASQLNLQPLECIVVEDAAAGIHAGKAGGFHTLGIGPHERVGEAEVVMDSLKDARLHEILSLFGQ